MIVTGSVASSLDFVNGRQLKIDSTSQNTVCNTCSVTKAPFKTAFSARFVSHASLSETPEKCGALGG